MWNDFSRSFLEVINRLKSKVKRTFLLTPNFIPMPRMTILNEQEIKEYDYPPRFQKSILLLFIP